MYLATLVLVEVGAWERAVVEVEAWEWAVAEAWAGDKRPSLPEGDVCLEVMEPGHQLDLARGVAGWRVTAPGLAPVVTACVPIAVRKCLTSRGHPVML